jgi:hypothetical protein
MALAEAFHTNGLGLALDVVRYSSMAWINSDGQPTLEKYSLIEARRM